LDLHEIIKSKKILPAGGWWRGSRPQADSGITIFSRRVMKNYFFVKATSIDLVMKTIIKKD